jgi:DNA-binding MurR/RpiR family transcriptional regulator
LGYTGLPELKRDLGARLSSVVPPQIQRRLRISEISKDVAALAQQVVGEAHDRLTDTEQKLDPAACGKAIQLLVGANEVMAYGWGASEMAARYLALKLNRIGGRARFVGATGFALADELLPLGAHDTVVLFAPGRLLPDLNVILNHAEAVGAGRILVTESLGAELAARLDVALVAPTSKTGITAEPLSAMLVVDILLLGIVGIHKDRSVDTYDLLTRLREEVLNPEKAE